MSEPDSAAFALSDLLGVASDGGGSLLGFAAGRPRYRAGESSDAALIGRLSGGEPEALDQLFAQYGDTVFRCVRGLSGSAESAQDLTQEVFLQVLRSAPKFAGRSSVKTWLLAITRNVCRAHRRRGRVESGEPLPEEPPEGGWCASNPLGDPWSELERSEIRRRVHRALFALPAAQREVLVLRDWQGLSYRELSELLTVPVGTVRSRLFNARATLAERLDECELEGDVDEV